jgi:hypothetical protein
MTIQRTLPKVTFEQMPLELETEMILYFLDWDWSEMITKKYPPFLKIKEIKSKKIKMRQLRVRF